MVHGQKSLSHGQANQTEGQDQGQIDVSNNVSSHESSSVVVTMNTSGDPHGGRIWPGKGLELGPPSCDHETDIEAQDESDRNEISKVGAIQTQVLKSSFGCKGNK